MTLYAAILIAFLLTCSGLTVIAVLGRVNRHIDQAIRRDRERRAVS